MERILGELHKQLPVSELTIKFQLSCTIRKLLTPSIWLWRLHSKRRYTNIIETQIVRCNRLFACKGSVCHDNQEFETICYEYLELCSNNTLQTIIVMLNVRKKELNFKQLVRDFRRYIDQPVGIIHKMIRNSAYMQKDDEL